MNSVSPTIKLYDTQPYEQFFSGQVVCAESTDRGLALILDQTLFFPEEGGQCPDRGVLAGFPVLNVQIKGDVITHYLPAEAAGEITAGQTVEGQIDWSFRYENMQCHSGEHLFSGLVHQRFGYENVGFHLGEALMTMDYSGPLSPEDLRSLEEAANRAVWENVPILAEYPAPEVLASLSYRSKKELSGDVRIVTIPGYDCCACCAPHLRSTAEIGLIKVLRSQAYKGGTRVTVLCGARALAYYQGLIETTDHLVSLTSRPLPELAGVVEELQEANKELTRQGNIAREALLMAALAEDIKRSLAGEIPAVIRIVAETDANLLRRAAEEISAQQATAILMGGESGAGAESDNDNAQMVPLRFVFASKTQDMKAFLGALRETAPQLVIRGGGSPTMVQGTLDPGSLSEDSLMAAAEEALRCV